MEKKVIIYTDGACRGNQFDKGHGGWGAILRFEGKEKEIWGGETDTTNNRMEMTAVVKALETLKTDKYPVEIYSDSAYIVNCFKSKWYVKWEQNGWKNAKKEPVENRDLWERLLELYRKYSVSFVKVKGHSGDEYNEKADALANKGADEAED